MNNLGRFPVGSIPDKLTYHYNRHFGDEATATLVIGVPGPLTVIREATVDGHVSYEWQAGDMDTPGEYEAHFRVIDGDNVYHSPPITWTVYTILFEDGDGSD